MLLQKSRALSSSATGAPRQLCRVNPCQCRNTTSAGRLRSTKESRVLVPIGTGSEEMETVIIVDVLRRAGAQVIVASVEDSKEVTCAKGIKLVADRLIGDAAGEAWDLIALPGGMPGAEHLRDSQPLEQLLKQQVASGKLYAAICASPVVVLEAKGMLAGRKATSHPSFSQKLSDQSAVAQRVVVDGPVITSRGPGTTFEFALELVKQLYGQEKAQAVAGPMVMPEGFKP